MRENDWVNEIDGKFDFCIHLAANSNVVNSIQSPEEALENIEMTFNVIEFLRKKSPQTKLIFASSREVYGSREEKCDEEKASITLVENPYGASKIGSEALINAYSKSFGLRFVTLRLSNVYGKYDLSNRVIPTFIRNIHKGKPITIFGKEKCLDFIFIDDVIRGFALAIEKFENINGKTFNIMSGKTVNLIELANLIKKLMGKECDIVIKPNRVGEVMSFNGDISLAQKLLSFEPQESLEEGLKKTIKWFEEEIL